MIECPVCAYSKSMSRREKLGSRGRESLFTSMTITCVNMDCMATLTLTRDMKAYNRP